MDAPKTCCYGLILFAFVGAAALEVADVLQWEVERRILDEADEPLQEVPKEENHEEHLALLQRVDVFVVQFFRAQPSAVATSKDQAQQIDGPVGAKGEISVINDLQGSKG